MQWAIELTNTLAWSWNVLTGGCLEAAATEHTRGRLAGYSQKLPAQQLTEKNFILCKSHTAFKAAKNKLLGEHLPTKGEDQKMEQGSCPLEGYSYSIKPRLEQLVLYAWGLSFNLSNIA